MARSLGGTLANALVVMVVLGVLAFIGVYEYEKKKNLVELHDKVESIEFILYELENKIPPLPEKTELKKPDTLKETQDKNPQPVTEPADKNPEVDKIYPEETPSYEKAVLNQIVNEIKKSDKQFHSVLKKLNKIQKTLDILQKQDKIQLNRLEELDKRVKALALANKPDNSVKHIYDSLLIRTEIICPREAIRVLNGQVMIKLLDSPSLLSARFDVTLPNMNVHHYNMEIGTRKAFECNKKTYFLELISIHSKHGKTCAKIEIKRRKSSKRKSS